LPAIGLPLQLVLESRETAEQDVLGLQTADVFAAAPSLNLTPEEKRVFGQLFREADKENIGVVTGEVAVKFFEKTRLEPRILGEVCISRPGRRLPQKPADGA
jgi:hypothetical protein